MMNSFAELPLTITAGWIVVLAWSIGQAVMWTRLRTTTAAPVSLPKSKRERPPRRVRKDGPTTIFTAPEAPEFVEDSGLQMLAETSTESMYR
jgi:hypothetical protein